MGELAATVYQSAIKRIQSKWGRIQKPLPFSSQANNLKNCNSTENSTISLPIQPIIQSDPFLNQRRQRHREYHLSSGSDIPAYQCADSRHQQHLPHQLPHHNSAASPLPQQTLQPLHTRQFALAHLSPVAHPDPLVQLPHRLHQRPHPLQRLRRHPLSQPNVHLLKPLPHHFPQRLHLAPPLLLLLPLLRLLLLDGVQLQEIVGGEGSGVLEEGVGVGSGVEVGLAEGQVATGRISVDELQQQLFQQIVKPDKILPPLLVVEHPRGQNLIDFLIGLVPAAAARQPSPEQHSQKINHLFLTHYLFIGIVAHLAALFHDAFPQHLLEQSPQDEEVEESVDGPEFGKERVEYSEGRHFGEEVVQGIDQIDQVLLHLQLLPVAADVVEVDPLRKAHTADLRRLLLVLQPEPLVDRLHLLAENPMGESLGVYVDFHPAMQGLQLAELPHPHHPSNRFLPLLHLLLPPRPDHTLRLYFDRIQSELGGVESELRDELLVLLCKLDIGMGEQLHTHFALGVGQRSHIDLHVLPTHRQGQLDYQSDYNMPTIPILLLALCQLLAFAAPRDLPAFQQQWVRTVPEQHRHDVTHVSTGKEKCGDRPCSFHYYVYENEHLLKEGDRNRTLLLVGGLRGNDTLGPYLLLNSYGKIQAARVLYFPLANPSGFAKDAPTTQPEDILIETDFPLRTNELCNRTSAFRILEHLFLTYPIDLTVVVHEGPAGLGYSWSGEKTPTPDRNIQESIADMMKRLGNSDLFAGAEQMKSGEGFGPAGQLVDWAYGSTHFPSVLSKSCNNVETKPYLAGTMKGMALSLGLGSTNASLVANINQAELFLERGLFLLQRLAQLANPTLQISGENRKIALSLLGCKMGALQQLTIYNAYSEPIFHRTSEVIARGDVNSEEASPTILLTDGTVTLPADFRYEAKFTCDNSWSGQGHTFLGQLKHYSQVGTQGHYVAMVRPDNQTPLILQMPYSIISLILSLLAVGWLGNCLYVGIQLKKARKLRDFNERFEHIEYIEDMDAYESSLSPKPDRHEDNTQLNEE